MKLTFQIQGGDFTRAGIASSQIKKMLKQLNIDAHIIKKTVIALYEAEVNIVAHAYEGKIFVTIDPEKIYFKLTDEGPGIDNIEMAMQEGFSTASPKVREMGFGAGMGLPNIKKNSDIFIINSTKDIGTTLEITNFFKPISK